MRKRQNNTSSDITTRSQGPLTDDEIEEIRQAYQEGCKGEILIGMRGKERVITMLLPVHSSPDTDEALLKRSIEKIKGMGCSKATSVVVIKNS